MSALSQSLWARSQQTITHCADTDCLSAARRNEKSLETALQTSHKADKNLYKTSHRGSVSINDLIRYNPIHQWVIAD
jgi:hypothetical protein